MSELFTFEGFKKSDLCHYGIKGQKWGVRRFQNPDGTLTPLGKKRYGSVGNLKKAIQNENKKAFNLLHAWHENVLRNNKVNELANNLYVNAYKLAARDPEFKNKQTAIAFIRARMSLDRLDETAEVANASYREIEKHIKHIKDEFGDVEITDIPNPDKPGMSILNKKEYVTILNEGSTNLRNIDKKVNDLVASCKNEEELRKLAKSMMDGTDEENIRYFAGKK